MTVSELAAALATTRQNLANKLSRNDFSEKELREIAAVLDCDFKLGFTLRDI